MIISHKHKFIFIKTRKTASTSIEIALSSICGLGDIITPISEQDEEIRIALGYRKGQNFCYYPNQLEEIIKMALKGRKPQYYNHMPAAEIIKIIPSKIWETYFKFCFDRNPFDKVVSYYFWKTRKHESPISFSEFIRTKDLTMIMGKTFYRINGNNVVDTVYRYEDLGEAFQDISFRINLPESISLPSYKAKSGIRKQKDRYQKIINAKDKLFLEHLFNEELVALNYTF